MSPCLVILRQSTTRLPLSLLAMSYVVAVKLGPFFTCSPAIIDTMLAHVHSTSPGSDDGCDCDVGTTPIRPVSAPMSSHGAWCRTDSAGQGLLCWLGEVTPWNPRGMRVADQ
ncbi:hypothetical protein BCR44DRAFT_1423199 [Catenaria anguillulae PL171]|uniref:Uncharacterized protein n=1 Tax=Catenaria anguillulae PL171 TaxID=765915 RepID=A0A1Y2I5P3_9FUNG|nr:hypothetical protein BCR44DRAFT_1423199 [Catenaria anguillulae PL171]